MSEKKRCKECGGRKGHTILCARIYDDFAAMRKFTSERIRLIEQAQKSASKSKLVFKEG
jgi:hypothetical protein